MSDADDLKERLAKALEVGSKRARFDAHMQRHEFKKAADVAGELGGALPRHVVVDLQPRRTKPLIKLTANYSKPARPAFLHHSQFM